MQVSERNPEGIGEFIGKDCKNSFYIRKWEEPLFLDQDNKNISMNKGMFLMPGYIGEDKKKKRLKSILSELTCGKGNKSLLILGEPGGGKSTLISYVLHKYEDKTKRKMLVYPCSSLRNVSWSDLNYDNLLKEIAWNVGVNYVEELSGIMLILDGLDEVHVEGHKEQMVEQLFESLRDYPDLHDFTLLITCRKNFFRNLDDKKAPYLVLKKFSEKEIDIFCERYFERKKEKEISEEAVEKLKRMKEVFGIPILLYMTIALEINIEKNDSESDIYDRIFTLEEGKGGIYERCWDRMKHPITFKIRKQIHEASKYMAYWMLKYRPERLSIDYNSYQNILRIIGTDSNVMLGQYVQQIHHMEGNNTECVEEIIFVHKTIYEYFLARGIIDEIKESLKHELDYKDIEMTKILTNYVNIREFPVQTVNYLKHMIRKEINRKIPIEKSWMMHFSQRLMDGMQFFEKRGHYCNISNIDGEITAFLNYIVILRCIHEVGTSYKKRMVLAENSEQMTLLAGYIRHTVGRTIDLNHIDLRGINLQKNHLEYARFMTADLQQCDLTEAYLHKAHLREADMRGANFDGANLQGADLRGADLRNAKLQNANLSEVDLREAKLDNAKLTRCILKEAKLERANLQEADLTEADLTGADLREANLDESNLIKANLYGSILRNTSIKGAKLNMANLQGADLREACLEGAKLNWTNLEQAKLNRANLSKANLNWANLSEADMSGAKMEDVIISNANLQGTCFENKKIE